jgi:maltose phosphorylase
MHPTGFDIEINGEKFDLNACSNVKNFVGTQHERRLVPSFFEATLNNGTEIAVSIRRFLSIVLDEVGVINYEIRLEQGLKNSLQTYIDAGV